MLRNGRLQKANSIAKRHIKKVGMQFDGRLRKTRVPCSCFMCGNPRKHWGQLTIQEQKLREFATDEFATYDYEDHLNP